jgi:hypothetical protein
MAVPAGLKSPPAKLNGGNPDEACAGHRQELFWKPEDLERRVGLLRGKKEVGPKKSYRKSPRREGFLGSSFDDFESGVSAVPDPSPHQRVRGL